MTASESGSSLAEQGQRLRWHTSQPVATKVSEAGLTDTFLEPIGEPFPTFGMSELGATARPGPLQTELKSSLYHVRHQKRLHKKPLGIQM